MYPDFQEQTIAPISRVFTKKEQALHYLNELKQDLIDVMNEEQDSCNYYSITEDTYYLGNTRFIASVTVNVNHDMNNNAHKEFLIRFSGFGITSLSAEHITCTDKHVNFHMASVTVVEEEINL